MDPGLAAFAILAVISGVIGYLAVQQGKIKRRIEESHRQETLANPGSLGPSLSTTPPDAPPEAPPFSPSDAEGHHGGSNGHH